MVFEGFLKDLAELGVSCGKLFKKTTKKTRKGLGLVHLTRLELAHPKALPPQGSVYTNFTTGA